MKIDNTKLTALHKHLVKGGSPEQADVAKVIGEDVDDEAAVEAYSDALKAKWPGIYGKPAAPAEPAPATYRLRKPDGTVSTLEVVASRNGTVVLEEPRPTDKVTIMLKGQPVVVDLIELRANPLKKVLGVEAVRLIEMAELAKA